jgi:hypothetical protein
MDRNKCEPFISFKSDGRVVKLSSEFSVKFNRRFRQKDNIVISNEPSLCISIMFIQLFLPLCCSSLFSFHLFHPSPVRRYFYERELIKTLASAPWTLALFFTQIFKSMSLPLYFFALLNPDAASFLSYPKETNDPIWKCWFLIQCSSKWRETKWSTPISCKVLWDWIFLNFSW